MITYDEFERNEEEANSRGPFHGMNRKSLSKPGFW
jgi:hypothetical protein